MARELKCTKCGTFNAEKQFHCSACGFNLRMAYSGPPFELDSPTPSGGGVETAPKSDGRELGGLERRYRDAYLVSDTLVGFGSFVKVMGVVLGILMFFMSLGLQIGALVFGGFLLATAIGLSIFVYGLLVSAQGQILRANLDTAVSSLPLVTDEEKLKMMGL